MDIVFLPTAQHDEHNPWLPNERGIRRIVAAMAALTEDPKRILVISGGYANHRGFTYSDRMVAYIVEHYPWAIERLRVVHGLHNRTVEDVFQAVMLLAGFAELNGQVLVPAESRLYFCSELMHYARSERTILTMGLTPVHVDSGADAAIYDERDWVIAREDEPGKVFGLGTEASAWAKAALGKAAEQADFCQAWALAHPAEDDAWAARVLAAMVQVRAARVYIESTCPAFPRPQRPPLPCFELPYPDRALWF